MPYDFELIRHGQDAYATWGKLFDAQKKFLFYTVERPFVDNDNDGHRDSGVSRFFPGLYRCFLRKSHLHGGTGKRDYDVWQFEGVPDVVAAQIHIANFPWELEGCVALGSTVGPIEYRGPTYLDDKAFPRETGKSYPGVGGSTDSIKSFMQLTTGKEFIWVQVTDSFSSTPHTWA